ncbi:MAG: thermonuclease family protein, partial [Planctomycetes bacterium]|nr:thermonuclease family protein [Planctomycetota bacterium]
ARIALLLLLFLAAAAFVAWGLRRERADPILQSLPPLAGLPAPDLSGPAHAVLDVIDGDTVAILIAGERTKVRLKGIDTPETVHPTKPVQHFGPEASRFLHQLLDGESVYLLIEPGAPLHDKYDRTLGYLYRASDGLFINAEIVRLGYGRAYTRYPFQYIDQFVRLEAEAREAGRGMWARNGSEHLAPNPAR